MNDAPPTDVQIAEAQQGLGVIFHPDYIAFIKSGYDMGDSILEPLEINSPGSHVDIFETASEAWDRYGLSRELLPIVEDNANYYCLKPTGEVVYWSHDGSVNESWPSIAVWRQQMIDEESV